MYASLFNVMIRQSVKKRLAAWLCLGTIVAVYSNGHSFAQIDARRAADSVSTVLRNSRTEVQKAEALKTLSFAYRLLDPSQGVAYADLGIKLSHKKGLRTIEMDCYLSKGLNLIENGDVQGAKSAFEHSLKVAKELKTPVGAANARAGVALVDGLQGKTDLALKGLLDALGQLSEGGSDLSTGNISNLAGIIFQQLGQYPKALQYHLKALRHLTASGDPIGIAEANANLARTYQYGVEDYGTAMGFYQKAFELYQNQQYGKGMATVSMNIGTLYFAQGKNIQAMGQYLFTDSLIKSAASRNIPADTHGLVYLYNNLGVIQTNESRFGKASAYLHQALVLAEKSRAPENVALVTHSLGELYWKQSSSTAGVRKRKLLAQPATSIETAAASYRASGNLQFYPLGQQQLSQIYLAQKRYPEAVSALQEHIKYKDSLFNRQREREYVRREMEALLEKKQDSLRIEQIKRDAVADLRLRQQWLFSGGALLFLAGVGGLFFYRSRMQQARLKEALAMKKAQQEETTARFQADMSAAALTSLRSQMNPHFIFNCLNSIKLYAAKNDGRAATEYLSKFSRLMRLVLENSKTELITLAQEEEMLTLYLELEAMRLKSRLVYTLNFAGDIDKEYVELPPMLVQPYVENAIWHGLMPRQEGGHIDILFEEERDQLIVTIRDDGVGREKAAALKSVTNPGSGESLGSKITGERVQLFGSQNKADSRVTIQDLYSDGKPLGTQVVIQIPII